jgi:hypothetical protein
MGAVVRVARSSHVLAPQLALLLAQAGCWAAADEAPALPSFYLSAGFSSDMVSPCHTFHHTQPPPTPNPIPTSNLQVLQQAPAKAAIYGVGEGPVSVSVSGTDGAGAAVRYTVAAFTEAGGGGGRGGGSGGDTVSSPTPTWKAFLKPTVAGGSYTVTAKGKAGTAVLEKVTYGDVYFCSGQSNMVR